MKYFKFSDFTLRGLAEIKEEKKMTVGIAIPVLNEEKTLKKTLQTILSLGDLVDECIVLDSGSTDRSGSICRKFGIPFYKDIKTAKVLGVALSKGKGWNLWSSLFYLKTDIIIWIDSDIENFNENFIIGIVGPLLVDDNLQFVKGYYERPKGDARVTEIMARPFLNALFPRAADIIQPLSGEYGGKRTFLEQIDFYSGYSVEVATLVQALYGLKQNQLAQSYLGLRIHELQSVTSLGRMSASILNTLMSIAEEFGYLDVHKKLSPILEQFDSIDGKNFSRIGYVVKDKKLPSILKNKSYARKFK